MSAKRRQSLPVERNCIINSLIYIAKKLGERIPPLSESVTRSSLVYPSSWHGTTFLNRFTCISPFHLVFLRAFPEKRINLKCPRVHSAFSSGIEPFDSIFYVIIYNSIHLNRPLHLSRVLLKKSRRPSFLRPSARPSLDLTNSTFSFYPQLRSFKLAELRFLPRVPQILLGNYQEVSS